MIHFFMVFLTGLFAACSVYAPSHPASFSAVRNALHKNNEVLTDKGFQLYGQGWGLDASLKVVSLMFETTRYKLVEVRDARKIFLQSAHGYLQSLNALRHIRPWFYQFPLTLDNFELLLDFLEADGKTQLPFPYIESVRNQRGYIEYRKYDPVTRKHIVVHKETYEEAWKIFESERQ